MPHPFEVEMVLRPITEAEKLRCWEVIFYRTINELHSGGKLAAVPPGTNAVRLLATLLGMDPVPLEHIWERLRQDPPTNYDLAVFAKRLHISANYSGLSLKIYYKHLANFRKAGQQEMLPAFKSQNYNMAIKEFIRKWHLLVTGGKRNYAVTFMEKALSEVYR